MASDFQRQRRLQIIFLVIIGLTLPCYGLGYTFVSLNRRNQPTRTPGPAISETATPAALASSTPGVVIPTRFPTFTPSLTPTITPTASRTPTLTPRPTDTPTRTITPSFTSSLEPTYTPTPTANITPIEPPALDSEP